MVVPLTVDDWPLAPIRTARLVLRAPEARDREAILDLGADDEVNRFLGGGRDRAVLDAELPAVPADRPGQFVVEHEGEFVGWFGLGRRDPSRPGAGHVDEHRPDLELSYVTPRSAWGRGFATEAAAAVLGWADAVLGEPIVLCTQAANARSLALALRLGFTEVARFEEFGAEQWFGLRHPGVRRATPADATRLAAVAEAAYTPVSSGSAADHQAAVKEYRRSPAQTRNTSVRASAELSDEALRTSGADTDRTPP